MAWVSSCVAPRRRTSVSTSFSESSGRASAFVVASFMVAYSSASWACGWSCNNPGYAAFFNHSSTTFDHSSSDATPNNLMDRRHKNAEASAITITPVSFLIFCRAFMVVYNECAPYVILAAFCDRIGRGIGPPQSQPPSVAAGNQLRASPTGGQVQRAGAQGVPIPRCSGVLGCGDFGRRDRAARSIYPEGASPASLPRIFQDFA